MSQVVDFYKVLEVSFGADKSDITSSYRRLVKIYHPDINRDPRAVDIMKSINQAYYTLCDDIRRAEYNNEFAAKARKDANFARDRERDNKAALETMGEYFESFRMGDYKKAYELVSEYDKQYVTYQSFCKWRESVRRLFAINSYAARMGDPDSYIQTENGRRQSAKKIYVSIDELDLTTRESANYQVSKHVVRENGSWRVVLGYRDLNEIARVFETLSKEQEKTEMQKHWEEYCANMCRELDMLSLQGFLKEAEREVYRYERYGQLLTLALFRIDSRGSEPVECLQLAADALRDTIRITDIPAYLGDGLFVVLLAQLKKRHTDSIVSRIAAKVRTGTKYSYMTFNGGNLEDYVATLKDKIARI